MAASRAPKRGFTLVELMIVVSIVGVLASLAVQGVRKYVAAAKTTEARNALGRMARDASAAYDRDQTSSEVLSHGESTVTAGQLCPSSAWPVPSALTSIAARKYQSSPSEWDDGAGWTCLKFSMRGPQYFQYYFASIPDSGGNLAGDGFEAIARGDLDGDGEVSRFQIEGEIQEGAEGGVTLTIAPNIGESAPEE